MTKTSHVKNRPFDFKLIDLVEPHTVLYQRQSGMSTFEALKVKNELWKEIAPLMNASIDFCIMRWGNLRGQFQKELRNSRELCPKTGVIRGSTWPYLERLRFLEKTVQINKSKTTRKRKRSVSVERTETVDSDEAINEFIAKSECNSEEDETIVSNDLMDEIIRDENYTIIEESTEEPTVIDHTEEVASPDAIKLESTARQVSAKNLQKMATLLMGIDGENRARVERRIMAFLCKCQLRALTNDDIDDLYV